MSQFHSLQSPRRGEAESLREQHFQPVPVMSSTRQMEWADSKHTDQLSTVAMDYQSRQLQLVQAEQYTPAHLQPGQTTQSLVLALQATMDPKVGRSPIVIPGSRKRARYGYQQTDELERFRQPRRLKLHLRHGLVMLSTLSILVFTLLSLAPLGNAQGVIPGVGGMVSWSSSDQQAWQIAIAHANKQTPVAQNAQQQADNTKTNQAIDNLNLPRSQYVDVAKQDAIKYGISPYYFVRQIQQESGFNPYAQSPVGAIGIAQLMPSTAAELGVNPYDPIQALDGAARFMASLSNQFYGDYAKALAGYNAGPGAVQNAVRTAGSGWLYVLPYETQHYVNTIMYG